MLSINFRFTTPELNYTGEACIQFDYYAYGEGVGALGVYLEEGGADWGDYNASEEVWGISGNQGEQWFFERIPVLINTTNTSVSELKSNQIKLKHSKDKKQY